MCGIFNELIFINTANLMCEVFNELICELFIADNIQWGNFY